MPRQLRYRLPGVPQHVVQRGNNRQVTFFDEGDYRRCLEKRNRGQNTEFTNIVCRGKLLLQQ